MKHKLASPSLIGQLIDAIPTPAAVADLDLLNQNLRRMADYFASRHAKIRPHFKSHKCVELSRRQLAAGSCSGVTCAKLSEAEQLAAGGIEDILVANQVIGMDKARRLAALNRDRMVRCAVDSVFSARQLAEAAKEAGVRISVFMEVDTGMKRCGVLPGEPALELAREISRLDGLRLDGIQAYEGHLVSILDFEERRRKTEAAFAPVVETRKQIEQAGIPVGILSSAGTGTYDITGNIAGIDEVQVGSYALMDWSYALVRPEFVIARWILATVVSARSTHAVVDVGTKGIGCEFGSPKVEGHPDVTVRSTSEEHVPFDGLHAQVGEKVRLVPSHGCTTHGLHHQMWIVRDGIIVDVWPIEGAGCLE